MVELSRWRGGRRRAVWREHFRGKVANMKKIIVTI
jgi:hypothetical protein